MDPGVISAMVSVSPRHVALAPAAVAPRVVQKLKLYRRPDAAQREDKFSAMTMSADASQFAEIYDSANGGSRRGRSEGLWVRGNVIATRYDRNPRVATANARMTGLLENPAARVSDMRRTLIRYSRYQSASDCRGSWLALQEKLKLVLAEEADSVASRMNDKAVDETIVKCIVSIVDASYAREAAAVENQRRELGAPAEGPQMFRAAEKRFEKAAEDSFLQPASSTDGALTGEGCGDLHQGWGGRQPDVEEVGGRSTDCPAGDRSPAEDSQMFFFPERRRRCADTFVPSMGEVGALSAQRAGARLELQSADSPTATPVTTPLAADCAGKVWA